MSTDNSTCVCAGKVQEPGAGSGEQSRETGPGEVELRLNNDFMWHWLSTVAYHVVRNLAA